MSISEKAKKWKKRYEQAEKGYDLAEKLAKITGAKPIEFLAQKGKEWAHQRKQEMESYLAWQDKPEDSKGIVCEYKCNNCGYTWTEYGEPRPIVFCPLCGNNNVKLLRYSSR